MTTPPRKEAMRRLGRDLPSVGDLFFRVIHTEYQEAEVVRLEPPDLVVFQRLHVEPPYMPLTVQWNRRTVWHREGWKPKKP